MKPYGEFIAHAPTLRKLELGDLLDLARQTKATKRHYARGLDALRKQQKRLLDELVRREGAAMKSYGEIIVGPTEIEGMTEEQLLEKLREVSQARRHYQRGLRSLDECHEQLTRALQREKDSADGEGVEAPVGAGRAAGD